MPSSIKRGRMTRETLARALLGSASAAGLAAIALTAAVAQRAPESILPPGFGQPPPPARPRAPEARTPKANAPAPASPAPSPPVTSPPADPGVDVPRITLAVPRTSGEDQVDEVDADELSAAKAAIPEPEDLPAGARRSLDRVGLATSGEGPFDDNSFAGSSGAFLSSIMRSIDAPIASRWASIVLRRALVAAAPTPGDVNGADWVGERAWLLVRMGEADNARALVARVDSIDYTAKLYDVAMQAALATADPAGLCGIADDGAEASSRPAWPLAQAMCAGLSGDAGTAGTIVSRVRSRRQARGIDVLLAEKVSGAGLNTKRVVMIQWDGVDQLTAWRYGLAAATGVPIPPRLMASVGPQVQAWQARAPLYTASDRAPMADAAATMGVFSNSALVDLYGSIWDETDVADRAGTLPQTLADAYRGDDAARLAALRKLWTSDGATGAKTNSASDAAPDRAPDPYARDILAARAAVFVTPGATDDASDVGRLIASMLSAGLDIQAARWTGHVADGSVAWGLLAVSAPTANGQVSAATVREMPGGDDNRRIKFLIAGLAGLDRLSTDDATNLAERYGMAPLGGEDSWTRALERAVIDRAPGTVALLVAAGLQTREWRYVPPEHLYRIVSAMRRVGLEPEARMIAAEAVSRS